jgi:DNA-binding transcriptional regulator YiaG
VGTSPVTPPETPLAHRIKALRRHLGLSTAQFGRLFLVTPRAIEQWEAGRRAPRGLTLQALEKELVKRQIWH